MHNVHNQMMRPAVVTQPVMTGPVGGVVAPAPMQPRAMHTPNVI